MALKKKRKKTIQDAAKAKASLIDNQKEAEEFEKDYVELIVALNSDLENSLDEFVAEGIKILRDSYQFRPHAVLSVLKEQEDRLRAFAQTVVECIEPTKDTAFRNHTVKYAQKIVGICAKSIEDQYTRAMKRAGIKPN